MWSKEIEELTMKMCATYPLKFDAEFLKGFLKPQATEYDEQGFK